MTSSIAMTGLAGPTYKALFRKQIRKAKPPVFGMAVAYVSASGFNLVKSILDEGEVGEVRLVTDTKDGVTHPKALQSAMDSGWKVRVVDSLSGTFHPKLYVGAAAFDNAAGLSGLSLAIVGSPNLSRGGFLTNGECCFWSSAPHSRESAARAWLECWNIGTPLTKTKLQDYEKYFALRNRNRLPADLVALGIADSIPKTENGKPKKGVSPPKTEDKAVSETAASVAWAGLQSFTGEYNLQLEFPKEAGLVLRRVFGKPSKDGSVDIICADHQQRKFKYKYYDHNGMFRLNIPNSAPLVDWARANKTGIAYVEHDEESGDLYFEIVPPGQPMMEIVDRSLALGTWGRTTTRLYGWY
ncbi:MAG: phospholipase D family protein [Alphaproteobacteria bacterium]|nr:phospholipase D family protein [Alphaproteobacteria bacterium]